MYSIHKRQVRIVVILLAPRMHVTSTSVMRGEAQTCLSRPQTT
jgi:hypothetical protein